MPVNLRLGVGIGAAGQGFGTSGVAPSNRAVGVTDALLRLSLNVPAPTAADVLHLMFWARLAAVDPTPTEYAILAWLNSTPYAQVYLTQVLRNLSADYQDGNAESLTPITTTWAHFYVRARIVGGVNVQSRISMNSTPIALTAVTTAGVPSGAANFDLGGIGTDNRFDGAFTSFKWGVGAQLSDAEVLAESASRTAIKSFLTAHSLNGSLGSFAKVGSGSTADVAGPAGLGA